MERRSWVRPAIKWAFTAFLVALFNLAGSSAHADFFSPDNLNLPSDDAIYVHMDQSESGDVIATANGCGDCFLFADPGYLLVSTNGGSTFTQITSIGRLNWSGVEVSHDGKTIVALADFFFYISPDSGQTFTRVDAFNSSEFFQGSRIKGGSLSGDGKALFIFDSRDQVLKYTYKSNLRRWSADLIVENYNRNDISSISTNYDGTKTYIASPQCSITRLTGTSITLLANTVSYYSQCLSWRQIRTDDTGNNLIGLADITRGPTVFTSTNGGSSLSVITQVNGVDLDPVTSVAISSDANARFFSTFVEIDPWNYRVMLFTQHGPTAQWIGRESSPWDNYSSLNANGEGTILIGSINAYGLRIYKGAPRAPYMDKVASASTSSINVYWNSGFDAGSDSSQAITDVIVEYSTSNTGPWTVFNDGVSGGQYGTITVTGLSTQTNYYFRVKTRNSFGTSPYSPILSGLIYGKPSTPAAPTRILNSSETFARISFNEPTNLAGASVSTETQWQFSTNGGSTWNDSSTASFSAVISFDPALQIPVLLISGHTPGAELLIRSRTSNGLQWSDWSSGLSITFYKKALAPANFQANLGSTTATLTWGPSPDLGGETFRYYIFRYKTGGNYFIETTTSLSITVSNLQQGSFNDFEVQIYTARGTYSYTAEIWGALTSKAPAKLHVTRQASGAKSGSAFDVQPKVTIQASDNTAVLNDSSTVVYAEILQNAKLIGVESATAVAGVATFTNLGIRGVAGVTYGLQFRSGSLETSGQAIVLQAGALSHMRFGQKTIGGKVGEDFSQPAKIELLDGDGNLVTWDDTTTVTISTNNGFLGSASFSDTVRAIDGLVTFNNFRILGAAGTNAVFSYSATGLTTIQETITITTGEASKFVRVVRAQDAYVGEQFGVQPTYRILDAADNVVTAGEFYIYISSNQGVLTGQTVEKSVNGIVSFKNLGIADIAAGQLVILTVDGDGFTPYSGDSIITRQGRPQLGWSNFYLPRNISPFTIPTPDTSTAGSFTYTSSNSGVLSISGSTATVVSSGTATVTATFTPADTTSYLSGETITAVFTVNPGAGTLILSLSGGATAAKGVVKTMTATASDSGSVTFYINGKRVPGCLAVKTQSSVATCNWKPANQGSVTITALLVPTNSQIAPVTASAVNLNIGRRTGRR